MKTVVAALVTSLAMVGLGMPAPSSAQDSAVDMTAKPRNTVTAARRMTAEVLAVNRVNDQLRAQQIVKARDAAHR